MIRSILYVPADSERFLQKAHQRGADAIALDLEDSVAPARKDAARANLAAAVPRAGSNGARVLVRINPEDGRWVADAEAACAAGAFGIILPKTRDPGHVAALSAVLERSEREVQRVEPVRIIALVEDANAVFEARDIARASPRMFGMIAGGEDLATGMGARPTPSALLVPKLLVHLAAKAAGVLSIGLIGSIANYSDLDEMAALASTAREHGFDAATCIHPGAVPILNGAFGASPQELAEARVIVAAAERAAASGLGAFSFGGRMIDPPIVLRARRLLGQAR